jgi:hypothetical protein
VADSSIWAVKAAVLLLMISGCDDQRDQHERHISVAHCDRGELYVRERVQPASSEQLGASVDLSLYYVDARGQRMEISASPYGSYRAPTPEERVKTYSLRHDVNWHLFIAPAAIDADGYEMLASCIAHNMTEMRKRVAAYGPLDDRFGPRDRVLPEIATIRYGNLADLQKRYECAAGRVVDVREDGLLYQRHGYSMSFLGTVFEDGKSIALDDLALDYLATQVAADRTPDPLTFLRECRRSNGASMFQDFAVSVLPDKDVWARHYQGGNMHSH